MEAAVMEELVMMILVRHVFNCLQSRGGFYGGRNRGFPRA